MKKILLITIVCFSLFVTITTETLGTVNNISSPIDAFNAGTISANYNEVKIFKTNNGIDLEVKNYDAIIQSYINFGYAQNKEEAEKMVIERELFLIEANKQNISVTKEELDSFITEQKSNLNELRTKGNNTFDLYLEGIGITEKEYWILFRDEYNNILLEQKYTNYLYTNFIKEKLYNKILSENIKISTSAFDSLVKKELTYYNPEILKEFQNQLSYYKRNLRIQEGMN